jgi:small subunit ribosomal protein S3
MEEKSVINFKKNEFKIREYVKESLGKGKASRVKIEYTPVGEKIIISTHKPGLVIGRKGERIEELTTTIKKKFDLENPHIEIMEIMEPDFDSQIIADEIALGLERSGPLKFKVIAYRTLQRIMQAGALGAEIRLSGKLPGARAKTWRFAQGYLKKTGDPAKVVDRAQASAQTKPGTVGVKVSILSPHAKLTDRINIDDEFLARLVSRAEKESGEERESKEKETKNKKESKKKKETKKSKEINKEKKNESITDKTNE